VPPFVGLSPKMKTATWADPGQPGFLGPSYAPFLPNADGLADMTLQGVSPERLGDRKSLLAGFDGLRRRADRMGELEGADEFTRQAFSILTSSRLVEALDLEREDVRLREPLRPRLARPGRLRRRRPAAQRLFLAARRLVEAGVPRGDAGLRPLGLARQALWHQLRERPRPPADARPRPDRAARRPGRSRMDEDVSVIVWGEFGRTPKINANGGRDHWPAVSCALLAGGGMRHRAGDRLDRPDAGQAKDRPVSFRRSSPRCTTTSALTWARPRSTT